MKFSIFVFACLLACAVSIPISQNASKNSLGILPSTTSTTTPTSIKSTTTVKSTDDASIVPSETVTVAKDDKSTTVIVEITTAKRHQKHTEAPATVPSTSAVPSSTTVASLKSKISTDDSKAEPTPLVVVDNIKKPSEARKGRGSKKFDSVEKIEGKPQEKSKEEEKPNEETPEKRPEQKAEKEPKVEESEEKKTETEDEKKPEQKQDDDENIPTVIGRIVPAISQPRILSPEARSKGRKYKDIHIVQLESELEENGKYHYNYENEDGTIVHQSGEMKIMDHDGEQMMGESVEGSYSYKDDDGNTISVTYTADENGFRPVGAHIPAIPPAIVRSLAWQATAKPWVDPWVVKQEELRKARKISSKSEE